MQAIYLTTDGRFREGGRSNRTFTCPGNGDTVSYLASILKVAKIVRTSINVVFRLYLCE